MHSPLAPHRLSVMMLVLLSVVSVLGLTQVEPLPGGRFGVGRGSGSILSVVRLDLPGFPVWRRIDFGSDRNIPTTIVDIHVPDRPVVFAVLTLSDVFLVLPENPTIVAARFKVEPMMYPVAVRILERRVVVAYENAIHVHSFNSAPLVAHVARPEVNIPLGSVTALEVRPKHFGGLWEVIVTTEEGGVVLFLLRDDALTFGGAYTVFDGTSGQHNYPLALDSDLQHLYVGSSLGYVFVLTVSGTSNLQPVRSLNPGPKPITDLRFIDTPVHGTPQLWGVQGTDIWVTNPRSDSDTRVVGEYPVPGASLFPSSSHPEVYATGGSAPIKSYTSTTTPHVEAPEDGISLTGLLVGSVIFTGIVCCVLLPVSIFCCGAHRFVCRGRQSNERTPDHVPHQNAAPNARRQKQPGKKIPTPTCRYAHLGHLNPPDHFLCPISQEVMHDPVLCSDGHHNFERGFISKYLLMGNSTCPISRSAMTVMDLKENTELRGEIEAWVKEKEEEGVLSEQEGGEQPTTPSNTGPRTPSSAPSLPHLVVDTAPDLEEP